MDRLVGGRVQILVFALSTGLIFLSLLVAINLMLPFCALGMLDESLFTTSEKTSSGGWSDTANVTVFFFFASGFL